MFVGEIVKRNAINYPERDAIIFENEKRWNWEQANERTNRLSHLLQEYGIKRGETVSFLARNCAEFLEMIMACAKLGAIFAPVNYRFSKDEIKYVINGVGSKLFFVHKEYSETIKEIIPSFDAVEHIIGFGGDHGFSLDYETFLSRQSTEEPVITESLSEEDTVWICYTGGTTGRSKGVMLTHRNIQAYTMNMQLFDRIQPDDVYGILGAMFHIVTNAAIAYWSLGCPVVVMNFTPDMCLQLIQTEGITKMIPTATILKMLVDEQERNPHDVSSVRIIGTGGAPVNPETVRKAMNLFDCDISQYFGQTECAPHVTNLTIEDYRKGLSPDASEKEIKRLKSAGKISPFNTVAILDENDRILEPGKVGEIGIKGDVVMKGYWKQPELTAETLKNGWLHTGDLGYMDEEGYIFLVDRKKDMIITGGENVYSAEVEQVLVRHQEIEEVSVIGVPDTQWGEKIVAVIVEKKGYVTNDEELIGFCRDHLAGYKIPRQYVRISELPKAPTGKVMKGEIRKQFWNGSASNLGSV
jgi:acyl-CoA synthetase (AMP-forming)/AMP-acid ligase II